MHHSGSECQQTNPDRNLDSSVAFVDSAIGKQWLALGERHSHKTLRLDGSRIDGSELSPSDLATIAEWRKGGTKAASAHSSAPRSNPLGGGKRKLEPKSESKPKGPQHTKKRKFDLAAIHSPDAGSHPAVAKAMLRIKRLRKYTNVLLDSGNFQVNFASTDIREWMVRGGCIPKDGGHCQVCSPLSKICSDCSSSSECVLIFYDFVNKCDFEISIRLNFIPMHTSYYDIIIGVATLQQHPRLIHLLTGQLLRGATTQGHERSDQPARNSSSGSPNLRPTGSCAHDPGEVHHLAALQRAKPYIMEDVEDLDGLSFGIFNMSIDGAVGEVFADATRPR